ncbi:MAG: AAA family ATPase [Candidatus Eisenbacteria bacterium]|uniref:AAA family ATPase n=1 Tax=Eiseniibacteriota bacterium TaxID=2212470 RepID=A0A937XAC5_UNCEI|nr:AAA family ATPase [Candidatus Eisenbacteria bacterium]
MPQPQAIVFAGPNGSGKTTLALDYLATHPMPYLSADLMAEALGQDASDGARLRAGRVFFRMIDDEIAARRSFVTEVTLAGSSFRRVIDRLHDSKYRVSIVFVFLATAEACVARVKTRAQKGGHWISEVDVVRRFYRSSRNFWIMYRPLADRWRLVYNGDAGSCVVARGRGAAVVVIHRALLDLYLEITQRCRDDRADNRRRR